MQEKKNKKETNVDLNAGTLCVCVYVRMLSRFARLSENFIISLRDSACIRIAYILVRIHIL